MALHDIIPHAMLKTLYLLHIRVQDIMHIFSDIWTESLIV